MKIKYNFKNPELLKIALTHPSVKKSKNKDNNNYERMEFLGDSVLNLIIADLVYNSYQSYSEGKLSVIHANLVNTKSIAQVAQSIDLGKHMILDTGEEILGGRTNPKNLENVMEALIGAVYLDSNYDTIKEIVTQLWRKLIKNHDKIIKKDDKSSLQEWTQKTYNQLPVYKIENKEGLSHDPTFKVSVHVKNVGKEYAEGKSKKQAEQIAAKKMLNKINKDYE